MNHPKMTFLIATCLFAFACSTNPKAAVEGSDKDANGCKASAGYTWSNLKKECIRVFELPIQLSNSDNSFGAGVIFSEDGQQAEVFTKDGDFLLTKKSENNYVNESSGKGVFLKVNHDNWEFGNIKDGTVLYTETLKE